MKTRSKWAFPTAFASWGAEEAEAIHRVVKSNWFTYDKEVAAFEEEFSKFHDMKHGVMVNSGSSANLIAVAALYNKTHHHLTRGDKAAVPAVAWSTTYSPLVQHGLNLTLLDCDDTWNAAPISVTDDTKIIVGCSILGNPAHLQWYRKEAERVGAYLLEDNCESLGAIGRDRPGPYRKRCGTFGDISTHSFFASHQISAIEGGMILTDDDEIADLCRRLRAHGWTRDVATPAGFEDEYNFTHFGYNVRPLELHAAIAREQLKKLEDFRRQRHQNYNNMVTWTQDLPVKFPKPNGILSPFAINFTVEDKETRARLVKALRAESIDCRLPTGGSFRKHAYGAPWADQSTPNADKLHDTGLFLGNPPWAAEDDLLRAVKIMERVLR